MELQIKIGFIADDLMQSLITFSEELLIENFDMTVAVSANKKNCIWTYDYIHVTQIRLIS